MRNRLKVTAVIPDANSVVSFFRCYPLKDLAQRFNLDLTIIDLKRTQSVGWVDIAGADILYMQGPNTKLHRSIFDMARKMNIRTWIDYDDNVLHVPVYHSQYEHYQRAMDTIIEMVQQADYITTSTFAIKKSFYQYRMEYDSVKVVRNAIPYTFLSEYTKKGEPLPTNTIFWRGGVDHAEDLRQVSNELCTWLNDHPKYMFLCAGAVPWFVRDNNFPQERVIIKKKQSILDYMAFISQNVADVCVIPLLENTFNSGVSVNNWIEATIMQAACVKPQTAEYAGLPGVKYIDTAHSFYDAISEAVERRNEIVRDAEGLLPQVNNYEQSLRERYMALMQTPQS